MNDERLQALNPDAKLPAEPIMPVYRSDGSGTTFVFTDYLAKVSPMWKEKFGVGKSVNFPTGQAAILGAQFKLGKYVKVAPNFRMSMPKADGADHKYAAYVSCYFGI